MATLLLTAAVALVVLTGGGYRSRELPRFALTEIHRRDSLAASLLLVLHLGALWLDPQAQLRGIDLVVPFLSRQPLWWVCFAVVAVAAGWRVSRPDGSRRVTGRADVPSVTPSGAAE